MFYARYRALINLALAIVTFLGIGIVKEPGDVFAPLTFFNYFYNNSPGLSILSGRWPLIILLVIFIYDVILQFTIRRRAIEVIQTIATIQFPQRCSHISTVNRTQLVRANRPGIGAYHMIVRPMPGGKVPKDQLNTRYQTSKEVIAVDPLVVGSESSWEIVDRLDKPLPFNLLVPSIPSWLLKWVDSPYLIRRSVNSHYVELDNNPEYYFGFMADRYTQKNVTIRMILPRTSNITKDKIVAFKIRDNMVERLPIIYPSPTSGNEDVIETYVKNLERGERVRLYWPRFTATTTPI